MIGSWLCCLSLSPGTWPCVECALTGGCGPSVRPDLSGPGRRELRHGAGRSPAPRAGRVAGPLGLRGRRRLLRGLWPVSAARRGRDRSEHRRRVQRPPRLRVQPRPRTRTGARLGPRVGPAPGQRRRAILGQRLPAAAAAAASQASVRLVRHAARAATGGGGRTS